VIIRHLLGGIEQNSTHSHFHSLTLMTNSKEIMGMNFESNMENTLKNMEAFVIQGLKDLISLKIIWTKVGPSSLGLSNRQPYKRTR